MLIAEAKIAAGLLLLAFRRAAAPRGRHRDLNGHQPVSRETSHRTSPMSLRSLDARTLVADAAP
jgi:hypothetical protein